MNQTKADFFPNLKESILKAHAISWAHDYPKIPIKDEKTLKVVDEIIRVQRIVLYKAGSIEQIGVKYVIVFELPEIPEKYKEMVWYSDVLEQMIDFPDGPPFVSQEFYDEVYNKQPDGDSRNEWLFKWIRPCEVLDVDVIEGSKTVLFQDDQIFRKHKVDKNILAKNINQAEHFPHLLKKQLELYALDWVKQYPDVPIQSIVLYAYMSKYEQYFKGSINIQYAVVFEIDETEEEEPIEPNGNKWAEYRHKKITGEIPTKPYEELLADTRAFTCDDVAIIKPAAFKNVYRQPPPGHYRGEWKFILKFLKTELPEGVRTSRPCWILFSSKQVKDKLKPRPNQQDKIACKKIAEKIWDEYPILDIVHMVKLPAIIKIVGKLYKGRKTVHDWLKEVAPPRAKRGGIRSPETRLEQKKTCEELGIKHDFKL